MFLSRQRFPKDDRRGPIARRLDWGEGGHEHFPSGTKLMEEKIPSSPFLRFLSVIVKEIYFFGGRDSE